MRVARAPVVALAFAARLAVGAEPPPEPPEPGPQDLPGTATSTEPWNVVATRPILVRTRAHPGTRVKEIWASAVMALPAEVLQETLLDGESFPRFMPYVKEVRTLPVPTTDGSWFTYQLVAPPLVAARDCVFHNWVVEAVAPDGTGRFRNRWEAVPGLAPSAPGAVRTLLSTGSWDVKPTKDGGSRVAYRFLVDPGGNVPTWLADLGNRTGIPEVFKALEAEARRRSALPRRTPAQLVQVVQLQGAIRPEEAGADGGSSSDPAGGTGALASPASP